jgi:hypothetical protein
LWRSVLSNINKKKKYEYGKEISKRWITERRPNVSGIKAVFISSLLLFKNDERLCTNFRNIYVQLSSNEKP